MPSSARVWFATSFSFPPLPFVGVGSVQLDVDVAEGSPVRSARSRAFPWRGVACERASASPKGCRHTHIEQAAI